VEARERAWLCIRHRCDDFWTLCTLCDYYDKQHGTHEEKIEKLKKKFPSI